ncbi:hypothetical protein BH23CHL1_BH23CHL1_24160 [soil metagenome]
MPSCHPPVCLLATHLRLYKRLTTAFAGRFMFSAVYARLVSVQMTLVRLANELRRTTHEII